MRAGIYMNRKTFLSRHHLYILFIALASLFLRFQFRDFVSLDMERYLQPWYDQLSALTFREALVTQVGNYNLLYQLIIYLLTRLPGEALLKYKTLSVLFDLILAAGIYSFVKKIANENLALLGFALTLFLPTVWLNSAAWAQCDSIYVAFIIWSLYYLYDQKEFPAFICLGLAFSFKLQTIFILPFILYIYVIREGKKEQRIHWYHFCLIPAVMFLTAIPNLIAGRHFLDLFRIYLLQTDYYKDIALNYPSFWNLLHLSYAFDKLWCIGFTGLLLLILMILFSRKNALPDGKDFLWCAFLLSYTCVLFLPAMHERYGYLYEILALLLAFSSSIGWISVLSLQLLTLQTYNRYLYSTAYNLEFLSILNIALYLFMLYAFFRRLSGKELTLSILSFKEDLPETGLWGRSFSFKRSKPFLSSFSNEEKKEHLSSILLLTGIFVLLGSMHLGQMKAPTSGVMVGQNTEEGCQIFIRLSSNQYVDSVCVYPFLSGKAAFRLFYAKDGDWEQLECDETLGGVFTWKRIEVKETTYEFCLIIDEAEAEIGEIVCLDGEGKQIPLADTSTPAQLYDEQDILPETPTGFNSMVFDEVYHGRTAYEFLHTLPIYENTHPTLGKILISIGIAIFGMNPFGYRIVCLLFGIFCIPLIYLFVLRITGKRSFAFLGALLQITEFMHYSLSRIATIDVIVAFFVLCMFYGIFAFLQEERYRYLIFSGISFGFGVATKWTALYAAAGIALILLIYMILRIKQHTPDFHLVRFIFTCCGVFILFPACVYVLSYIPFAKAYPDQNIFQHAVSNSINMLNYHKSVNQPHSFESKWYTWLFDWIPLVDFRTTSGSYKCTIATFVNPFICFAGLISVFHHLYLTIKKDIPSALLIVFYLAMLLPWVFISRTVFIYQYFICTKILILMICHSIQVLPFQDETKVIRLTGTVSAVLFVIFFPVISGIMVNANYINQILNIFPKWWF